HPDDVGVGRVDGQRRVVPGALAQVTAGVDQLPRVAAVVGAEQAALLGLDQGVDDAAVGGGDGDADLAPELLLGQAFGGKLLPGVAAVARDEQAAGGVAALHLPGPADGVPQAGEQDVRVGRVEADVGGAGAAGVGLADQ